MELKDCLTIIAILVGPIAAVWISVWHGDRKTRIDRKLWIFRALMGGRSGVGEEDAIRALNLVPVEFAKNTSLISYWKTYIGEANDLPIVRDASTKELEAWENLMIAIAEDTGNDGKLMTNLTLVLRDSKAYFRVFPDSRNGYSSAQGVHILKRNYKEFLESAPSNISNDINNGNGKNS